MTDVERIKSSVDIVDVASRYTSLQRSGNKFSGLCPFHNEKTPSFFVDSEKQLFHCFGCGEGGDVITLAMKANGLSFQDALNHLAKLVGISLSTLPRHDRRKINEVKGRKAALSKLQKVL